MGIAHRAEPSVGCTFDVWDGVVSAEDVQEYLVRLASDRAWPAGHAHLTDLTTLASASVPDPAVLDALYEGTGLADKLTVAVLLAPDVRSDTDLRYATATDELAARTFRDPKSACAYLGIDETRARGILDELRQVLRRAGSG